MKYVIIQDVMEMAGMSRHHGQRTLEAFGLKVTKRPMMAIHTRGHKPSNRIKRVVTEKDAKRFLESRNRGIIKLKPIPLKQCEELLAKKREKEGWLVIRTYKGGLPDLILIRRNKDKNLELIFEDAKSGRDAIQKDQYLFAGRLEKLGVKTNFTWIDD